ncbi:MAG TPA: MBL fold metallo-hydrolase [Patescibacteria group bacterium]|nr:MBL fold metallo-hydrolase [Patescibacteria group bacterium]
MKSDAFRFALGKFQCLALLDGISRYPAGAFFTNVQKEKYESMLCGRGESAEEIAVPYIPLCIDAGNERVLVDTGMGAGAPSGGRLLSRLRAEGIEPRDIGTVIISHAHPDHVGANLDDRGKPAFPKARYVISKEEWDFWLSPGSRAEAQGGDYFQEVLVPFAQKNLLGIQGQVELLEQETEILPGISAISAPGHTPGHIALSISSGAEQLVYLGDAVCHPLHLEYPETLIAFDLQPIEVVRSRRRLLRKAAREAALVHSYHFPYPGLGYVIAKDEGWQWEPLKAAE